MPNISGDHLPLWNMSFSNTHLKVGSQYNFDAESTKAIRQYNFGAESTKTTRLYNSILRELKPNVNFQREFLTKFHH